MMLFIDTTEKEAVNLDLISDKRTISHVFQASHNLSEILIPEIQNFLKKQKIKFAGLGKIAVMAGPGQFSRVRTAVAAANALAYGLKIPVVGIKAGEKSGPAGFLARKGTGMVKPFYDRQPNITLPKKNA